MLTHALSKSSTESCQFFVGLLSHRVNQLALVETARPRERLAVQEISVSPNQPFAQRHRVLPAKRGQSTCVQKFSWSTVGFRSVKRQASSESRYLSDMFSQFPHSQIFTAANIKNRAQPIVTD